MKYINIIFILSLLITYAQHSSRLNNFSFNEKNIKQVKLDRSLKEISGLSLAGERLFAHDDEKGYIFQLDTNDGKILKYFRLGERKVYRDFEGIAVERENFYLITSNGDLYLCWEQKNKRYSSYKKFDTGLNSAYDIEGLCYDPETHTLLIACKGYPGKNFEDKKAVYSFNLTEKKLERTPRFLISLEDLKKGFNLKYFSPTGIERDPVTGNFFIISSREKSVVEIDKFSGKIINVKKLSGKIHNQPEGIAVSKNYFIISDEGNGKRATLTFYPLK